MTTSAEISAYLGVLEGRNQKNWSWGYVEKQRYWYAEFGGTIPPCKINIEISDQFLCLQISIGDFRIRPECRPAMDYFLLRLNDELPVVKFGMGQDGKIDLMAEVPGDQINLASFDLIVQLLVETFKQHRHEIEMLASDRDLAELIVKPLEVSMSRPPSIKVLDDKARKPQSQE
jgi:hypothetical protein